MSFFISPFDKLLRLAKAQSSQSPLIPQGQAKESAGIPLNSDSALYFGDYNSNASLSSLVLNYEIMDSTGSLNLGNLTLIPETDRTGKSTSVKIGNYGGGRLISAAVIGNGTVSRRGQTYVFLYLLKGSVLNTNVAQLLIADYLDKTNFTPSFPGHLLSSIDGPGYIYNAAPASPAVGAEVNITVPSNAIWRVLGAVIKLTASSTAIIRTVLFGFTDGTNAFFRTATTGSSGTSASQTNGYFLTTVTTPFNSSGQYSGPDVTPSVYANGDWRMSIPDMKLPSGFKISSKTTNLQGGDQYTIDSFVVEEWIQV